MPQTLLAVVAIVIFALFALSQHEATADAERTVITAEVEAAAGRLARQRLADVLARAFDEADLDAVSVRTSPLGLSTLGADPGEATEALFDDLDDFHARPARTVTAPWMDETLDFTDSVAVRYLDPATLAPVAGPTLMKEVEVTVRAVPAGFVGTPRIAAVLRQIATPTP